jgi:hypothetical protein
MSWDSEARKLLGFVGDDNARGLVKIKIKLRII